MIKKAPVLLIFLIPILLVLIYFNGIKGNSFLFLHDEFLLLNKQESLNTFFTQNPLSLGIANTTVMIVTIFERLYYLIMYALNFHLPLAQKILYFLKLFILLLFPYIGFRKINTIFSKQVEELSVFIISLWYSFNTYTLIYLHGNAFSLTILICYALAPLAFYYYHKSIFASEEIIDKFKAILLLFLMSFGLYLYAAFLLFILAYTCLYSWLFKVNILKVLKNIIVLGLLFAPFLSIALLIPYEMFFSPSQTLNLTGGETFTNLQGGFLYQFLMWYSWGIYTYWHPRNIFTFDDYFRTIPSLLAPFIIYALLIPEIFRKKKKLFFLLFLFLFLLFLFLIKGAQGPFGEIYTFLLKNVAPFRVFRSPDSKFGFTLVLILSILLLQVASNYRRNVFVSLLGLVILIQGYLIFNGVAVRGENTSTSSERIVTIPNEYYGVANFLNNNSFPYGYVMPIPSVEFGHYTLEKYKFYIGQDILPKLVNLPFLYISDNSGIEVHTYSKLSVLLNQQKVNQLSEFPIKYILLRKDTQPTNKDKRIMEKVSQTFKEVYKNELLTVFENRNFSPIIQSSNISFKIDNPIKYEIFIRNLKTDQKLYFNHSYNSNWSLYPLSTKHSLPCDKFVIHKPDLEKECFDKEILFDSSELNYFFIKPLFAQTHTIGNGYANQWTISPNSIKENLDKNYYTINSDGSVNLKLVLYFKTQAIFYLGVIISVIYFLIILFSILENHGLNKRIKS